MMVMMMVMMMMIKVNHAIFPKAKMSKGKGDDEQRGDGVNKKTMIINNVSKKNQIMKS
jgi:hypothetical protein